MPRAYVGLRWGGDKRDERDVGVCGYRGRTGYSRGYFRHSRSFLTDGAPLRRADRKAPGIIARRGSVPAEGRAATGPRPGREPGARGPAARVGPRDGRLSSWPAAG